MSIEGEIVIRRPIEEVFDFVADERNEPAFNPRMLRAEKVTEGPIGTGTRFLATMTPMGRKLDMTIEFTAYERPTRLATSSSMSSADTRAALTFEPHPEGTRMRWSWDAEARGLSKRLTPLINRIGTRQEELIWASLKRHLEAIPTTRAANAPQDRRARTHTYCQIGSARYRHVWCAGRAASTAGSFGPTPGPVGVPRSSSSAVAHLAPDPAPLAVAVALRQAAIRLAGRSRDRLPEAIMAASRSAGWTHHLDQRAPGRPPPLSAAFSHPGVFR